ncbi:hypothetical protein N7509_008201 [Penicillium cosmopolitanum]|uniref:Uncharacterized protein n=1 Tax=Penicillium cosmopolitanum TaxID=1131564 RepID=A0A9W9VM61_9EURO|nr:uncharacterized protein N7509_008201 [Penicillium cosmopolitanum]KAJ5385660.1 hypothetical protein N7509_008201 [Penicillium cosmopolitanum]
MAAEIGLEFRIDSLAQVFYNIRNYYSLTAVVQGIQASSLQTKCPTKYGKLVDPTGGYQAYRKNTAESPSLHLLLPALSALAHNGLSSAGGVSGDIVL